MLRADLAFFAADVLGMEIGDHHIEWSRLIREHKLISILAARGHGKSGFWSHAYPIWQSWRTPNNSGLIVSDTEDQVGEFFRIIKEGKEFRDEDGHLWQLPAVADVPFLADMLVKGWERLWTESKIVFSNRSRAVGKTFGKRFRGRHVPWIVVDDPIGEDSSYSEVAREKDKTFFDRALSPMLLRGGQLAAVGTPLHPDDLHAHLGRKKSYVQHRYPAITIDPETGEERPLWAEFRPLAWLHAKREEVGELAFGQEYLLRPATSEASLFPEWLFHRRPDTLATGLCVGPTPDDCRARGWTTYMGVDVALSAEVGADYTVVVVLAVDGAGVRHVVDVVRVKGLPFHAQLELIAQVANRYEVELAYIEANAAQRVFGDELLRTTDLPIGKFITSASGKHSLESGVPGLRTLIEQGRLVFAWGDEQSREACGVLVRELQGFSWVKGKLQGVGGHDDCVMAAWIADQAVRASNRFRFYSVSSDEPSDEDDDAERDAAIDAGNATRQADAREHLVTIAEAQRGTGGALGAMVAEHRAPPRIEEDDEEEDAPARPPPAPSVVSLLAAAKNGVVEDAERALAEAFPRRRETWIEAWNGLMSGGPLPADVGALAQRHGLPAVEGVLRQLLGIAA